MRGKSLALGKIPPETLEKIVYPRVGHLNPRLLLGPGIGRDVAAVNYDRILVLTCDPITGTSRRIGEHSVYINANDVATAGARPVWYLCTILLPPRTTESSLSDIMKGIDRACKRLGVSVVRGHTEVTRGLDRPLVSGFMIGELKGRLFTAEDVHVGDAVLLTKAAGIEGTAILASDYRSRLKTLPLALIRRAQRLSRQISVVQEALTVSNVGGVRLLHDPTEGGVLNACWEVSAASGLGIEIWADKIPIPLETETICTALRLDPLKLMSSGCLLVVAAPSSASQIAKRLRELRVRVTVVGKIKAKSHGRIFSRNGRVSRLVAVPQDELYKLA